MTTTRSIHSIFARRFAIFAIGLMTTMYCASNAAAGPIFLFTGMSTASNPISGTADFTVDAGADTITVKLTNTTANTTAADELLTGIDFSLGGLSPSLSSATGIQRTVAADGTFSNTATAQSLSWSAVALGGDVHQLNFNPNAKDSIIGPPTAGSYSGANGSIKGNGGHNPFAAEMAVFVLSVPGLEDDTSISVSAFRYGTALTAGDGIIKQEIPEPSTWMLMGLGFALVALKRRRI